MIDSSCVGENSLCINCLFQAVSDHPCSKKKCRVCKVTTGNIAMSETLPQLTTSLKNIIYNRLVHWITVMSVSMYGESRNRKFVNFGLIELK